MARHRLDHHTGVVLAYVLSDHKDSAFLALKALLEPFGIDQFYTDGWGAYERHLDPVHHSVGKRNTQRIERRHLTLRTRIKRLVRKTICFSKTVVMHDVVIGLYFSLLFYIKQFSNNPPHPPLARVSATTYPPQPTTHPPQK